MERRNRLSKRLVRPVARHKGAVKFELYTRIGRELAELQAMIDDPATSEAQKINFQTAIKLYHEHELPGRFKWIQDGKVVRHKDIDFRRPYWVEVLHSPPPE
ncbi:hypothetical protein MauCBS54593_001728 [Microsporum audouinii]